jgi:hypothetical protein
MTWELKKISEMPQSKLLEEADRLPFLRQGLLLAEQNRLISKNDLFTQIGQELTAVLTAAVSMALRANRVHCLLVSNEPAEIAPADGSTFYPLPNALFPVALPPTHVEVLEANTLRLFWEAGMTPTGKFVEVTATGLVFGEVCWVALFLNGNEVPLTRKVYTDSGTGSGNRFFLQYRYPTFESGDEWAVRICLPTAGICTVDDITLSVIDC